MSKTKCLLHIVFATKGRRCTIPEQHKKMLFAYILGIINNKKCFLHRINGVENHLHMLIDLHPSISLADFMKTVKQSSTFWLRRTPEFSDFDRWGEGYYAASLGVDDLVACKEYIKNQEAHHYNQDFLAEMETFANKNQMAWYPDDWD